MDDAAFRARIEGERSAAMGELAEFRDAADEFVWALRDWWNNPTDATAARGQQAAIRMSAAFNPPLARLGQLYADGVIVERPDLDIPEGSNGE